MGLNPREMFSQQSLCTPLALQCCLQITNNNQEHPRPQPDNSRQHQEGTLGCIGRCFHRSFEGENIIPAQLP